MQVLPIHWSPCQTPLEPRAAYARGPTSRRLAGRLLQLSDAELAELEGVSAPGVIVVLGKTLPWVDGVRYLGLAPGAPSLYLPTERVPSVPPALLERSLTRKTALSPLAVLIDPPALLPLDACLPLERGRLLAFLQASP